MPAGMATTFFVNRFADKSKQIGKSSNKINFKCHQYKFDFCHLQNEYLYSSHLESFYLFMLFV